MAYHSNILEGKTALITGCNRGIGKATVRLFAENGANLICCIRKEDIAFLNNVESLKKEFQVMIDILYFDMNNEDSIKQSFVTLQKEKRRIDILVNNAGVAAGGLLQMTSLKSLKEIFQVNFFSLVLLTQLISKLMIRQKSGCIINMGSIAGLENFAGYTAYGSSKAAVMCFTRTIAKELATYNVRVNAIAPGLIDTSMAEQMESKAWHEMVGRSDMARLGKPEEIANMILFLASDQSSFITGQVYRVDGGM